MPRPSKVTVPSFGCAPPTLDDGTVLIVAQPLGDIGSTLHHLLLVELVVTGGGSGGGPPRWALAGPSGLRPLRDMELTAESIAAGNLTERVPGENDTTEVGRLARTLNVMLTRIESAFSARLASESAACAPRNNDFGDLWPTLHTSCVRRSPPSRPMPNCSVGARPSRRRTSSA